MQLTVDIPDSVDLFGLEGGLWIEAIRKVRTFAAFPEGDGYMRRHTLGVCAWLLLQAIDHVGRDAPDDIYLCKGRYIWGL